jgi:hypothetical protein
MVQKVRRPQKVNLLCFSPHAEWAVTHRPFGPFQPTCNLIDRKPAPELDVWRRLSPITLRVPAIRAQSYIGVFQQESARPSAAKSCFDATQLATAGAIPRPETTGGFRGRAIITAQAPSATARLIVPNNAVMPGWIC